MYDQLWCGPSKLDAKKYVHGKSMYTNEDGLNVNKIHECSLIILNISIIRAFINVYIQQDLNFVISLFKNNCDKYNIGLNIHLCHIASKSICP